MKITIGVLTCLFAISLIAEKDEERGNCFLICFLSSLMAFLASSLL